MVQGSRQWHEKLPFALLGYHTTIHTSVRATPYLLEYDTEVVIPMKVEISSLRIVVEAEIDDDEWVKTCLEQLSLIDKKRLAVVCHGQLYQKRMARAYNKKLSVYDNVTDNTYEATLLLGLIFDMVRSMGIKAKNGSFGCI
ncbi:uncharacterized protein [Nicotiana sylvestris]|uniref:uncharacterized protein n=1 Tax=Nicotiana sylvestris TaxID=4096 RepID=UPI00388C761A